MSKKFLPLAGIAVVLAIVSYLLLSFVFPHKHEVAVDDSIKPDAVFSAALDEASAEPTATSANQDDVAASQTDAQELPVGASDASTSEVATAALSEPIGDALEVDATNPSPEESAAVLASTSTSEVETAALSESAGDALEVDVTNPAPEGAAAVVASTSIGTLEVETAALSEPTGDTQELYVTTNPLPEGAAAVVASETTAEVPTESTATSEPVSEPVAEATPVVEVAQQETTNIEPEAVRSEPAPAPAKAAVAKAPSSGKAKPTARGKKLTGPDALIAWWKAPASGDFGLVYAGQAKGERTIALLFSTQIAAGALNDNIKVYDSKGKLVRGKWQAASGNPRLALLRGLKPGRYTVVIGATLADANGKAINKAEHGPVYVI